MFTSHFPSVRGSKLTTGLRALGAVGALGATLLAAVPAQAAVAAPARPYGTVTTGAGLNERMFPSTDSSVEGVLRYHEQVGLTCKVRAQNIEGNTVWYLVRHSGVWVSAKYVANTGYVRYCKDVLPARSPESVRKDQQENAQQNGRHQQGEQSSKQQLKPKG